MGFSRQEHWSRLPFPSPMRESEVAQSCPTLNDPMDCSIPVSSIHGIFQARKVGCHCFLHRQHIKKQRHCFDNKGLSSQGVVFPVVMYGCESWTIQKSEHQRIDAFELWCWKRLLRVPWTARRSNQSILKEISPGCSLERLMLKLKLQYFGHLMQRVDSLEKILMLGKTEGRRRRG